jgi:putative PIN family toxin of toxin-antitoxin system
MKVVVDANVFISGVFFTGPPHQILDAWRRSSVQIVMTPEILTEYHDTGTELTAHFPDVELEPWLELCAVRSILVEAQPLEEQVCTDPDDDKFLACALAGRVSLIVSGDKALLRASGYKRLKVLTPRSFVNRYL